MLQVKVQLRCRQHEKRDPTCPGCRHLAYFERRYDSMLTQRCRLMEEIRQALARQELIIIDLR